MGLSLEKMETSQMMDVLHFFFEQDMTYSSQEHQHAQSSIREYVYGDLYGVKYPYALAKTTSNADGLVDEDGLLDSPVADDLPAPFNPRQQQPTKGFMPATEVSSAPNKPFGDLLDAPVG